MPRKIVRVYLPSEIKPLLEKLHQNLGLSESEILRHALIEYAGKYNLVTEIVHR